MTTWPALMVDADDYATHELIPLTIFSTAFPNHTGVPNPATSVDS